MCAYLYDDYTIRQAMEKMESAGYSSIPILNRHGEYRGTLTEGDLLWALKYICYMDMRQAEAHRIGEIERRKDNVPVRVTTSMHDLIDRASTQNFVPVVDDKDAFIGIVTTPKVNTSFSAPGPVGLGERIGNRVKIPSGTATVSAEALPQERKRVIGRVPRRPGKA